MGPYFQTHAECRWTPYDFLDHVEYVHLKVRNLVCVAIFSYFRAENCQKLYHEIKVTTDFLYLHPIIFFTVNVLIWPKFDILHVKLRSSFSQNNACKLLPWNFGSYWACQTASFCHALFSNLRSPRMSAVFHKQDWNCLQLRKRCQPSFHHCPDGRYHSPGQPGLQHLLQAFWKLRKELLCS